MVARSPLPVSQAVAPPVAGRSPCPGRQPAAFALRPAPPADSVRGQPVRLAAGCGGALAVRIQFNYQPTACKVEYRMVVVRKNITKEKGELRLHDEIRYFFYITNDWIREANEIVFCANDRCDQENLLAQLHSGCRALSAPVDNLESNWAYMVMAGLAWDLKAWFALMLPEGVGRHQESYRADKLWLLGLEFKTFVQAFIRLPCQIVRTGRRVVYRLLSWNPYQPIFFRLLDALRC